MYKNIIGPIKNSAGQNYFLYFHARWIIEILYIHDWIAGIRGRHYEHGTTLDNAIEKLTTYLLDSEEKMWYSIQQGGHMTVQQGDDVKMSDSGWIASDAPVTNDEGDVGFTTEAGHVTINAEYYDENGNVVEFVNNDGNVYYTDAKEVIYDLRNT